MSDFICRSCGGNWSRLEDYETHACPVNMTPNAEPMVTGGRTNYYLVTVNHPNREEQPPYQAECEDLIHALAMTFEEGCEFKALWRTAAARQGNGKPGRAQLDQAVYDAEKRVHYATLSLKWERLKRDEDVVRLQAYGWDTGTTTKHGEFAAQTVHYKPRK